MGAKRKVFVSQLSFFYLASYEKPGYRTGLKELSGTFTEEWVDYLWSKHSFNGFIGLYHYLGLFKLRNL